MRARIKIIKVPPRAIDAVMLTHTHADHDAGTFQRILRTRQIKVYLSTILVPLSILIHDIFSGTTPPIDFVCCTLAVRHENCGKKFHKKVCGHYWL